MPSEEFEQIKDNTFYFDWNVISYLSELAELKNEDLRSQIFCLKCILEEVITRDRCAFPCSFAHFRDIRKGSPEFKESKLQILSTFTRNWYIQEEPTDKSQVRIDKCRSIEAHYEWDTEQSKSAPVDFVDPEIGDTFKSLASQMPNPEWKELIVRLAEAMTKENNGLEIARINKAMRNTKLGIPGVEFKFPEVHHSVLTDPSKDIHKIVDKAIGKSTFPFKDSTEYLAQIHAHQPSILSDFENEVMRLAALAEFVGVATEDLSNDGAFDSMTTDLKHLVLGLRCKILISADKVFRKKASFISAWRGIGPAIFSPNEFVEYILSRALSEPGLPSAEVKIDFKDQDQNLIRSYNVKIN